MKKNLLIALFATASMAGAAETTTPLDDGNGNWSIMMELNVDMMSKIIKGKPALESDGDADNAEFSNGVNLVSWRGDGNLHVDGVLFPEADTTNTNKTVAYWFGWGSDYFKTADSGMAHGLQMGFIDNKGLFSTDDSKVILGDKGEVDLTTAWGTNSGYYRAHTKYNGQAQTMDGNRYEHTYGNPETKVTEGDITLLSDITSITLAIVHDNSKADGKIGSITNQYLTITGILGEKEVIYTYIASVDDTSTTYLQTALPGSGRYDIDDLFEVNFADGYVNKNHSYVLGEALTSDEVLNFDYTTGTVPGTPGGDTPAAAVPEPTTATLSLLALAGLCARRRRR